MECAYLTPDNKITIILKITIENNFWGNIKDQYELTPRNFCIQLSYRHTLHYFHYYNIIV